MQWSDEGIVLGVRRHGESSVIVELMTREHGRHLGLVHGGRSRSRQPTLQPGNLVQATWRARLDEHLGTFQIEGLKLRAGEFMASPLALYGLATLSHLLRNLPERDPHATLYETLTTLLDNLTDPDLAPPLFVQFELTILAEFGFGLDLTSCAASGAQDDLVYVSPKSGRAVKPEKGPHANGSSLVVGDDPLCVMLSPSGGAIPKDGAAHRYSRAWRNHRRHRRRYTPSRRAARSSRAHPRGSS